MSVPKNPENVPEPGIEAVEEAVEVPESTVKAAAGKGGPEKKDPPAKSPILDPVVAKDWMAWSQENPALVAAGIAVILLILGMIIF